MWKCWQLMTMIDWMSPILRSPPIPEKRNKYIKHNQNKAAVLTRCKLPVAGGMVALLSFPLHHSRNPAGQTRHNLDRVPKTNQLLFYLHMSFRFTLSV